MGLLVFTLRMHELIHLKHDLDFKQMQISRKIQDLQAFSSAVGSGSVSISDLMSLPASMMGRTLNYLNYANNSSIWYMQQNAPWAMQWYQAQMGASQTPQQQAQMQQYIMSQLYQQGRDKASQILAKNLKVEEERLKKEQTQIQDQAQMVKEEMEATKSAKEAAIKDFTPKYA